MFLVLSIRSILINQRVQETIVLCNECHSFIIKLFEEGIEFGGCDELHRDGRDICNLDIFSEVDIELKRVCLEEMN